MNNSNLDLQEIKSIKLYGNGTNHIVKNNPELELQKFVDSYLLEKNVESIFQLTSTQAMNLNLAVQTVCRKYKEYTSVFWGINNPETILTKEEQEDKAERTLEMMLNSGPLD